MKKLFEEDYEARQNAMTYEDIYEACLYAAQEMGSDIKKMSWFSRSVKREKAAVSNASSEQYRDHQFTEKRG